MSGKTPEEVLKMCDTWLLTKWTHKADKIHAIVRGDKPIDHKLKAVREFAATRLRQPTALIAWIDEALKELETA